MTSSPSVGHSSFRCMHLDLGVTMETQRSHRSTAVEPNAL
jgi:hypothetical protein